MFMNLAYLAMTRNRDMWRNSKPVLRYNYVLNSWVMVRDVPIHGDARDCDEYTDNDRG